MEQNKTYCFLLIFEILVVNQPPIIVEFYTELIGRKLFTCAELNTHKATCIAGAIEKQKSNGIQSLPFGAYIKSIIEVQGK